MIVDAIEEAIFDAFGVEPPSKNTKPIKNARRMSRAEEAVLLREIMQ